MLKSILSVLLLFLLLNSCTSNDNPINKDDINTLTTNSEETNSIALRESLDLPNIDYEGYDFSILSVNSTSMGNSEETGSHFWSDFGYNADRSGEPINDAVYARNLIIEERYGISINVKEEPDVEISAKKTINAGDDIYDIVMPNIDRTYSMAEPGYIYELSKIPYINLQKPWWDNILVVDLAMSNKIYVATGDISMEDEEYNWCIVFNKSMINKFNLDNPYHDVIEGIWTYDVLYNMSKIVSYDVNGDGLLDWNDSFGYGDDYNGGQYLFHSAGERIATLNSEGKPELTLLSNRTNSIMDELIKVLRDKTCVIWVSEMKNVGNGWLELNNMLTDGRLLFREANIYNIKQYREMTDDFGLLPGPKFNDEQAKYYQCIDSHACSGVCVPMTATNLERTGIILEALAYESIKIKDAYYNVTLTGKYTRDEESLDMLKIIFDSRMYDIGKVFGWGNLTSVIDNTIKNGEGFTSLYEKSVIKAQESMEKSYELFIQIPA
ncbi:MAG: hypothetical protein ACYCWE_14295 [Eubacteriales bacterium]